MKHPEKCPECGQQVWMVEYARGNKYRYDGVSEYACKDEKCGWRAGRWCGQVLEKGMVEPPFCTGGDHPRVFEIEQTEEEHHAPQEE